MLGVVGGPLIFVSAIAVLFGAYEQDGPHALFSVSEFLFEAAFAIYLIVKGFRPSPILDDARLPAGTAAPCVLRLGRRDSDGQQLLRWTNTSSAAIGPKARNRAIALRLAVSARR
jgi:hypothetical protein